MFQIHYETKRGASMMRLPRTMQEVEDMLKRLAKRHSEAELIDGCTHKRIGAVEPVDEGSVQKWFWWSAKEPFQTHS